MNFDWVEPLCSAENAQDQGLELGGWFEQEATLESPAGHFHQGAAFRYEPESSRHAMEDAFHSSNLADSAGT